ncbi:ABC transporter permease [Achromobacter seleniivolatilans]|uniref:ABC transporter permease n=1 Tax=Achromobacter seleniivolatilans TaxID=3047478 RepID=A0ABY9M5V5_9BURK|nr:ABC transporter permease [Achromobacter sp. R39]WMD22195.1 ABC transporter permease [Achromobacter sp. R39]
MRRYLLSRFGQAIFVVWAAFSVSFLILYVLPGDPVAIMLDARGEGVLADPAQVAQMRSQFGLDKPVVVQYLTALGRAVQGDFGISIENGQDVVETVQKALPETLKLASLALLISLALGLGIALAATYTRRRWLSDLLLCLPPLGVSIPSFWIGLALLQFFSFGWAIFPATGNAGFAALVLPALTLAIPTSAAIAQVLAKSLQSALRQGYIDTAYAKGASRRRVHLLHALRNAAIPTLTLVGMSAGHLLGGSVVTETVFSRTGIGRLTEIAVQAQDIPMVQGLVVLSTLIYVLVNLLVDLLYPLFDPRIVSAQRAYA